MSQEQLSIKRSRASSRHDFSLMHERQQYLRERLQVYREDLADWFNTLFDTIETTESSFLDDIANGVLLCKLAQLVEAGAADWGSKTRGFASGHDDRPASTQAVSVRYTRNAVKGSFFARDNVATFIRWAKNIGVDDSVLFETNDLVEHRNEKNVLYCLMEVGRIQGVLEPPSLVLAERRADHGYTQSHAYQADQLLDAVVSIMESIPELQGAGAHIDQDGRLFIAQHGPLTAALIRSHVMIRSGKYWDPLEQFLNEHVAPAASNSSVTKSQRAQDLADESAESAESACESVHDYDIVSSTVFTQMDESSQSGQARRRSRHAETQTIEPVFDTSQGRPRPQGADEHVRSRDKDLTFEESHERHDQLKMDGMAELEAARNRAAVAEDALAKANSALAVLHRRDDTTNVTPSQAAELRVQIRRAEAELEIQRKSNLRLLRDLQDAREHGANELLDERRQAQAMRLAAVEEERHRLQQEHTRQMRSLEQALQDELERYKTAAAHRDLQEANSKAQLEAERMEWQTKLGRQQEQLKAMQDQHETVQQLQGDLSLANQRVAELENMLTLKIADANAAAAENEQLRRSSQIDQESTAQLTHKCKELENLCANYASKEKVLQDELESYRQQAQHRQQEHAAQMQRQQDLTSQIVQLQQDLAAGQLKIDKLEQELTSAASTQTSLQELIMKVTNELIHCYNETVTASGLPPVSKFDLIAKESDAPNVLLDASQQLAVRVGQMLACLAQSSGIVDARTKLQDEVKAKDVALQDAHKNITEQAELITKLREDFERAREEHERSLAVASQVEDGLRTDIHRLNDELSTVRARNESLQTELAEARNEILTHRESFEAKEVALREEATNAAQQAHEVSSDLRAELARHKQQADDSQRMLDEVRSELDLARNSCKNCEEEKQQLLAKLQDAQLQTGDLAQLQADVDQLRVQLKEEQQQCVVLEDGLDKSKKQNDQLLQELTQLRALLSASHSEQTAASDELMRAKSTIETLELTIEELTIELEEFRKAKATEDAELERARLEAAAEAERIEREAEAARLKQAEEDAIRAQEEVAARRAHEEHMAKLLEQEEFKKEHDELRAVRHDICEWLNELLGTSISEEKLMGELQAGDLLCALANVIDEHELDTRDAEQGLLALEDAAGGMFPTPSSPSSSKTKRPVSKRRPPTGADKSKSGSKAAKAKTSTSSKGRTSLIPARSRCGRANEPLRKKRRRIPSYGYKPPEGQSRLYEYIHGRPAPGCRYHAHAQPGTSQAKDNVDTFLAWSSDALGIENPALFEPEDLTLLQDQRRVLWGLLDIARRTRRMRVPLIVWLERRPHMKLSKRLGNDPLDKALQEAAKNCICQPALRVEKSGPGKYIVGEDATKPLLLRLLENGTVMVRVGGGWDTLQRYLQLHERCCHGGALEDVYKYFEQTIAAFRAAPRPIMDKRGHPINLHTTRPTLVYF